MRAGLLALTILAGILLPAPASAAEPSTGTVSPDAPVTWSGTFPAGSSNSATQCFGLDERPLDLPVQAVAACDFFALDVDVPDGYWSAFGGGLNVELTQDADADLDLHIYPRTDDGRRDGPSVGRSANSGPQDETAAVPEAEGPYWVVVVGYRVPSDATYTARATITSEPLPDVGPPVDDPPPQAVTAVIDSGINPYHVAFRDPSPLSDLHPARYLNDYPRTAQRLELTLDAPTLADALAADAEVWASVERGVLYYVPGTRIVGLISLSGGGVRCPPAGLDFFPANALGSCGDRPLLDDHGHGTMTASRATGAPRSLGAGSRIVAVEGLGAASVRWAGRQRWIDVQTNSWAELVATTPGNGVNEAFEAAARRQLVFAASGNGAGGFFGFVPHNTYQLSTAAPGVIVVGAHDNGRMTHWSGSPPTVVADGYGGWMAAHDDLTRYEPHPVACCTSASAPYAAGGAADLILQARTILGSRQVGSSGGVLASGTPTASGPLADGVLTLEEAHALLRHTAEARPAEGRDDGLVNWTGDPRAPDRLEHGPGGNPYCNGCQTLPVSWTDVPEDAPAYALVGYGAINDRTSALVAAVLRGELEEPARPQEDALYETDQNVRRTTR